MTTKYKTEIDGGRLPCGDEISASRDGLYVTGKRNWLVTSGWNGVEIQASSIPGIINLLKEMYNNSPKKWRKKGVEWLK